MKEEDDLITLWVLNTGLSLSLLRIIYYFINRNIPAV